MSIETEAIRIEDIKYLLERLRERLKAISKKFSPYADPIEFIDSMLVLQANVTKLIGIMQKYYGVTDVDTSTGWMYIDYDKLLESRRERGGKN